MADEAIAARKLKLRMNRLQVTPTPGAELVPRVAPQPGGRQQPVPEAADPSAEESKGTVAALQRLARYLPGELLATYVTASALISDDHADWQFALMIILLACCPFAVLATVAIRAAAQYDVGSWPTRNPRTWPIWQMIAAFIAFAGWAAAVHPSALATVLPGASKQGLGIGAGVVAILLAFALSLVGDYLQSRNRFLAAHGK